MKSRIMLVPKLFSHWWESLERPHRLLDQHFGRSLRPEQFFPTLFNRSPGSLYPSSFYQQWADMIKEMEQESGWSAIKDDKDKFRVALDVQQFKPEEVNVKVIDNYIVVEAKHEEKQDDHGIISRHFVRKYLVPDQCDPEKATSTWSDEGILTVTAPRKPEAIEAKQEKTIKIERVNTSTEEEPQKVKQKQ